MDEQRRMLDELMGKSRNEEGEKNKGRNFWDDDVDKFYLAGFSPFEEFRNTKSSSSLADCYRCAFPRRQKLGHMEWEEWSRNDDMKAQFDALPQEEKDKYGYEHDLMCFLEQLVEKCDHRIRVVQEEVKTKNENISKGANRSDEEAMDTVSKELEDLRKKITETEKQAEVEAAGSFEALQILMKQEDVKVKEKAEVMRRVDVWRTEGQRAVCDISGNVILPPGARHTQLHDHEAGKQFQGWKTARTLLKELKAKDPKPAPPKAIGRNRSRSARKQKSRSQKKSRSLKKKSRSEKKSPTAKRSKSEKKEPAEGEGKKSPSASRGRKRSRSGKKSRSGSKGRKRSRSGKKSCSASKDRKRSRSANKSRSGSKDRKRDRKKDKRERSKDRGKRR